MVLARLREFRAGGPIAVAALGVVLFATATLNFARELETVAIVSGPIAAYVVGAAPTLFVLALAYLLYRSEYEAPDRWRIAMAGWVGSVVVCAVFALTILIRLVEDRTVGEPIFALIVGADAGAIAGLLVGLFYVRARRDAAEAKRARDRFEFLNSMLRHDVLNRMTVIRSRANYIAENVEGREAEFADTIVAQVDAVSDEIDRTRAVLDALGSDAASLEEHSLSETLRDQVETLRATEESVTVETDIEDGLVVRADELLQDVFANVLSNAVEHNDSDAPHVWVAAETTADGVVARIADDGPGVPDEMKDAIFRRDETDIHDNIAGSGFGLFFVDTMMEKYGGTVDVEDREPTGSVFVFQFRPP